MKGFTIIDNAFLYSDFSIREKIIFALLKSFCFGNKLSCHPSMRLLSEATGLTGKTIQCGVNILKQRGLIKIEKGKYLNKNIYILQGTKKRGGRMDFRKQLDTLIEEYKKVSPVYCRSVGRIGYARDEFEMNLKRGGGYYALLEAIKKALPESKPHEIRIKTPILKNKAVEDYYNV